MSTLRFLLASAFLVSFLALLPAQSLDHAIPIDDGDPVAPDFCFGVAMAPDGVHAAVAISGDLGPPFGGPNNDNLAIVDVIAGTQAALAQTGLYPEDPAITLDAAGNLRHTYVTNSTSGSVSCFGPALQPVATIPLPSCFGGSSYPFSLLVSPDQTRIYVSTLGGCGDIDVIDSDPASPTFNTVVTSFTVPNSGARMTWWGYPLLVVTTTTYDASFSLSQAGFTVVDVTSPASQAAHTITSVSAPTYAFATGCAVLPGNRVLIAVGGGAASNVYQCDLATGAVLATLSPNVASGQTLHGLAVSPDLSCGAATALHGGQTVFFEPSTLAVLGTYSHGAGSMPNDVVFTPDGSRAVVSLQGVARVDVLKNIPGHALRLAAPLTVNLGASLSYGVSRCEAGQSSLIYFSLAGSGPQQIGPFTIYLSNPFALADEGVADVHGAHSVTFTVPNTAGLSGLTVSTQAGTIDRDGTIRVSNGAQTLLN